MSPPAGLHPRIAVSGISAIGWTLAQDLAFLTREGVGGMGVLFSKAEADPSAARDAIAASSLRASCVTATPHGPLITDGEPSPARVLEVLRPSIDFAATLSGVPCYFTAGSTPDRMPTDVAFDVLAASLAAALDYATAQGVRLALEHNNTATRDNGFVHSLRDAIELSEATGIAVCVEIQNCWTERHLPRMIRDHVSRFAVVQLSDYRVGETTRLNRRVLGDGSIPLEWLIGLLLDAGYAGWFEIETIGPAIEAEGYAPAIRRSIDWLQERLVRWGI